jgi:hypothetical protein
MKMSDPVTLYKRLLAAMRSGDDRSALPLFAPGFIAHEDPGMSYGGFYRGGEGFLELRRKVYDHWGPGAMQLLYVCGDPEGGHAGRGPRRDRLDVPRRSRGRGAGVLLRHAAPPGGAGVSMPLTPLRHFA